ncbi:YdbH domain-containing protein [Brevundimonas sp. 2R-24]|uniref:YdbH domain-containing protein n=1 Tax=Peiella sedimenti TaxID=3061083 RepID=A0ABT8SLF1_9CAUL|nr:YdbH domain-containing protein [Caulobacteraceae bacterium XZ-24]
MDEPASPVPDQAEPTRRARPRRGRLAGRALLLAGIAVVAIAGTAWLARRAAADRALTDWLARNGVEAEVEIDRLELDGAVGSILVGDPRDPELRVERVEIDYGVAWPWARGGFSVTPERIRLVRPQVKARLTEQGLSFGSLDPLIEELTSRPSDPEAPKPEILVEGGRGRLLTEWGPITGTFDARLAEGRLNRLAAGLRSASLDFGETDVVTGPLSLRLRRQGERLDVELEGTVTSLTGPLGSLRGAEAALELEAPYPDLERRSADGALAGSLALRAEGGVLGGASAETVQSLIRFEGQARGGWADLDLSLTVAGDATADALTTPDVRMNALAADFGRGELQLSRAADHLSWRFTGPIRAQAGLWRTGDLTLRNAATTSRLTATNDRISLSGAWSGRGAWTAMGPPEAGDIAQIAALKRALGDFGLEAPRLNLTIAGGRTAATLGAPLILSPASGGRVTVTQAGGPVYDSARSGGALNLQMEGGELPQGDVRVTRWRMGGGGFDADVDGRIGWDFDLARGVALEARGRLTATNGVTSFALAGCAPFTVERLELGENDVRALSGRLCPSGGPALRLAGGGWRVGGRIEGGAAEAPFLEMAFTGVEGALTASGAGRNNRLEAPSLVATAHDRAAAERFRPMRLSGPVAMTNGDWRAQLNFRAEARPEPLGTLILTHAGASGVGGLDIHAPEIVFAQDALQPAHLSPLANAVSKADGQAGFDGRVGWSASGLTSDGVLTIPSLDFDSPAGRVSGLSGRVVFDSLVPLSTAPGQSLTARQVTTAAAPLENVEIGFRLTPTALELSGGRFAAADGVVEVEPLSIPLTETTPIQGAVRFEHVQLGQLFAASSFAEKVRMDAVVSGRAPFIWNRGDLTLIDGHLTADQPGRISIAREALTSVSAEGGGEEAQQIGPIQDMAYQAMENLAFDTLSVELNSLPEGRLRMLFDVDGRHDPPQHQEIRLTLGELISRRFLDNGRTLPLPSDTPVDLTLDVTLNLDQLLEDLAELQRARAGQPSRSAPVQPVER